MTRSRKRRGQVGFVITPDAIKDKVHALDVAISVLDGDVRATPSTKLGAAWRAEWDAFVRRWSIERDTYASWSSRLFATYAMPRIEAFEANYRYWARQYQAKTGKAPPVASPAAVETMSASLIPTEVWWLVAGVAAYYVLSARRGL